MTGRCLHVIIVAYRRAIPLRIVIDSFIVQTDSRWKLHIIHDGPAPQDIKDVISLYKGDFRVEYNETLTTNGHWGHPNRRIALRELSLNHRDYVLITNDDNYYVPEFVKYFFQEIKKDNVGFVYCDTVHSYEKYNVLISEPRENHIDMGSFIVKVDVAKRVGFNYIHLSADGLYAEQCANYCRLRRLAIIHIQKPLFIHN